MSKKALMLACLLLSIGIVWLLVNGGPGNGTTENAQNDTGIAIQKDGEQYIKILALGGYRPGLVKAKANIDTKLEIQTKGTYDCSSSISIPKLNYRTNLPPTGTATIDISAEQAKDSIEILCGMGMFNARIDFEKQTL